MDNSNSLKKNIVRVFSANFIVTIVGFISSFVFPKILTIGAYAEYHTYTLYIGYIAILHLGFSSGMVINYAGKPYLTIDKKQYKSEVKLLLMILAFFTCCFFVVNCIKPSFMLLFVTLSIIPVCWVGSYRAFVQSWNDFKSYTKINLMVSVSVPAIAILYYVVFHSLPGKVYIIFYLLVYWTMTIYLLCGTWTDLHNVKGNKLFTHQNWETEKTGAVIVAGSYVNTLFASADKQFVSWFFTNVEFAYYSFAMSIQAIMTVLITSIAQPLFPAMAQGRFDDNEYNKVKKLLFVFGSYSGCAYFAISIIIKLFITKYTDSLSIASIYFSVFPAMAVIQCLYVNLYKIKGKIKTYVGTLVAVLVIAIVLNLFMVYALGHYTGIAIATTITYYIWLLIGVFQFDFIKMELSDILFLIMYFAIYFICTLNMSDIIGFFVYIILITTVAMIFYHKVIVECLKDFRNSRG